MFSNLGKGMFLVLFLIGSLVVGIINLFVIMVGGLGLFFFKLVMLIMMMIGLFGNFNLIVGVILMIF